MNLRSAFISVSVGAVFVLAGCGSSTEAAHGPNDLPGPAETAMTSSIVAEGHGAALDLRKVTVRVDSRTVTVTFTSFGPLTLNEFTKPHCAAAGVTWPERKISLVVPSYFQPNDNPSVKVADVTAAQVGKKSITVVAPRAAFPEAFRSGDAWRSYSSGPLCPPMDNELGFLPASGEVHPS